LRRKYIDSHATLRMTGQERKEYKMNAELSSPRPSPTIGEGGRKDVPKRELRNQREQGTCHVPLHKMRGSWAHAMCPYIRQEGELARVCDGIGGVGKIVYQ